MKFSLSEIQSLFDRKNILRWPDRQILHLLTDSRRLFQPENTLFAGLKTVRQDGHHYISDLYEKGVRAFLVRKGFDKEPFPEADFLEVPDPLRALQQVAQEWRIRFSIPCIGITGSNGKTIVKEWLFQLLSADYNVIRSPKSYNSQIGVPLSVAEMNGGHQFAIFEAGISTTGEMTHLEPLIRPSLGIFTNIGEAHAEGFSSIREKIREKLLLFQHAGLLIYRSDDPVLSAEILSFKEKENRRLQLFSWGTKDAVGDLLKITAIKKEHGSSRIRGIYEGKEVRIVIPFTDSGSVENAVHCWCMLLDLGLPEEHIRQRMIRLQPVAMRLEMKNGINNCVVINDSYNSDFTSIQVALDFLFNQHQHARHTLILSDIAQSGEPESELYKRIAVLIANKGIDRLIGIGPSICRHRDLFKNTRTTFFSSTPEFLERLQAKKDPEKNPFFQDEVILLKGSRTFEFEKISKLLEQKKHQNELFIDLNAVAHNLKTYQSFLKKGVKTMVMVKAFSYGSGSAEIANLLQFHGVDYLAVANIEEGIFLRQNGIRIPILILNPDLFYFEDLIRWELEPELFSSKILKEFSDLLARKGITSYPVHLKIDTGMHRLGFTEDLIPGLTALLKDLRNMRIRSVFSHLAASENPLMDDFTRLQGRIFGNICQKIEEVLPYSFLKHLANSSGISRHPDLQFDMVRLGIGLYGIDDQIREKLQVVSTLKTTIIQIRSVKAGETVGYSRAGVVGEDKTIAVAALGYADGYLRSLGLGKGRMLLHGKLVPTIGNICMDLLMLDITGVPEAREGDLLTVFGEKPGIEEVALAGGTIPYEILTGLSQRINRVYLQE